MAYISMQDHFVAEEGLRRRQDQADQAQNPAQAAAAPLPPRASPLPTDLLRRQVTNEDLIKPEKEGSEVGPLMSDLKFAADIRQLLGLENLGLAGTGGFGRLYGSRHIATGHKVALKAVQCAYKSETRLKAWAERTLEEVVYLSKFDHPNIVKLYGHAWLKTNGSKFSSLFHSKVSGARHLAIIL